MLTDAPHPNPHALEAPRGYDPRSDDTWALARRDYINGDSGTQVCDRYGLSLSTFNDRARREGWRRCDQPEPAPVPDDDPEADEPVDCAALAEDALVRVRRALRLGRAGEAASWMRLHEKLQARLEAGEARERRRERVAREQGTEGAIARTLASLRNQQTIIRGAASTHLGLTRAFRSGRLVREDYHELCELNDEVVAGVRGTFPLSPAPAPDPAPDPACSHPDFSPAPDP